MKLNGSIGATNYGALAAQERGPAGRFFGAVRVTHNFGKQRLGVLVTRVHHPWLDRTATVLGIDHHWQPTPDLTLWTNVVGSAIDQHGSRTRGEGITFQADYVIGDGWRQQWTARHFDDQLQVNDFGYLSRNNLDFVQWQVSKRITDLPADSFYLSHDWQFSIEGLDNDNHHLRLRRQLSVWRGSRLRDGGREHIWLHINSAAWNDLLTRGHGALFLPPSMDLGYSLHTPRQGDWAFEGHVEVSTGGLSGNRELGWDVRFEPTWYLSNAFRMHVGLEYSRTPDWLVWQHDALIGRFNQRELQLETGFYWRIAARQELRLKMQAIGLRARAREPWIVGRDGRAVAANAPLHDFSVRNFAVQIRYRYKLAPLSYIYVVYGRGGYVQAPLLRSAGELLRTSLGLRETERLLVKVNYRFSM